MAEDWVKAHRRLFSGKWCGVPRATRFVLLELAIEARAHDGVIELPYGTVDPIEGLVNLLSKTNRRDRREVREAIRFLASSGIESVTFETENDLKRARIPSFRTWNASPSSTDRMRAKRERDRGRKEDPTLTPNCDVTPCDGGDALEERRGEEIREEIEKSDAAGAALDAAARRVWDCYLELRSKLTTANPPKFDDKRKRHIKARLQTYGEPRVIAAVRAFLAPSSWYVAEGRITPEMVFRSNEQFEKHEKPPTRPQGSSGAPQTPIAKPGDVDNWFKKARGEG